MTSTPSTYTLPCAPSCACLDRFSVCPDAVEDENGNIQFWPLLQVVLAPHISSPSQLVDILETIAYSLRGSVGFAGDYELLKLISESKPEFFSRQWPKLRDLALQLPDLFPGHCIPVLGTESPRIILSRQQAACLIVHQFLCTLAAPPWREDNIYDFSIWYGSGQRHEGVARCYLEALFLYFEQGAENQNMWGASVEEWPVQYELCVSPDDVSFLSDELLSKPVVPVEVELIDTYDTQPASLGVPGFAVVISANRFIGFGQSATQEEVHVGISPEACPAVLATPPLQDRQALVVTGAQAMVNVSGTRRDIIQTDIPLPQGGLGSWKQRTMLFMDALEVDEMSADTGLPDLMPANIDREIQKAALAFSSRPSPAQGIRTGLWGCGAFCGDPSVKVLAMWCAASVAGTKLHIVCDSSQHESGRDLAEFLQASQGKLHTAGHIRRLLASAPLSLKRFETLAWFSENVRSD